MEAGPVAGIVVASVCGALLTCAGGVWCYLRRYPKFLPPPGPYHTIGCHYMRFSGSVFAQLFYPAEKGTSRSHRYIRADAIGGIANWQSRSTKLFSTISAAKHPCLLDAAPLSNEHGFPMMIFSPGLGGNCETYTQFCQDCASSGMLVICLEHECGAGSYAQDEEGKDILYRRPEFSDYTREKVVPFRNTFLQFRVASIRSVTDILLAHCSAASSSSSLSPVSSSSSSLSASASASALSSFSQSILSIGSASRMIIAGHSFGAATSVVAAQAMPERFVASILLDLWPFCLSDATLAAGLSRPTLSLLSNQFTESNDIFLTNRILAASSSPPLSFVIKGSAHGDFSDSVHWFPPGLVRKLHLGGEVSPPLVREIINNTVGSFLAPVLSSASSSYVWSSANDIRKAVGHPLLQIHNF